MKTMTSKSRLIATLAIATAFTAGFASGPATAQTSLPQLLKFEFKFHYTDAELGDLNSAQMLLTRLETEVFEQCGGERVMRPDRRHATMRCIDEAMQSSIAKFGSPVVAQAYQSRADG